MEEAINNEIIKATQVSLGKYVKRPPLSDKLLKKPPFRFLHDIITTVIKNTGFFKGLFEEEELISDNVKERESKILFLTKIISVLETTTGKVLSVKPTKIVAGQEPDKTNELLQSLAFALDNKLSSDEAVQQYKGKPLNETKSKPITKTLKKGTETKKLTSKSTDKLIKSDKNPSKTKQKEILLKKEALSKKTSQAPKNSNKNEKHEEKKIENINGITATADPAKKYSDSDVNVNHDIKVTPENENSARSLSETLETKDVVTEYTIQNDSIQGSLDKEVHNTENNKEEDIENDNKSKIVVNDDFNINTTIESRPTSAHLIALKAQNENKISDTEVKVPETKDLVEVSNIKRPNSVRPSSSRPGAPRIKEKHENILSPADNLVVGKVNIIAENTTQEEEEETSIVIIENADTSDNVQVGINELNSADQHGHLVQQILDVQKEFNDESKKNNIEWKFDGQKTKDVFNQDIEQLKFNVQALSRVANPLGKLLDHIQEDVEVMRQELQQWAKVYENTSKQLLKQKAANEESLHPLHSRVKQLEADIVDKCDKINDLKIIINKNAFRIDKLLANGNVQ